MKKLILTIIIMLCTVMSGFGQCDENIILTTKEAIDSFAQNYNCNVIEGNLTISFYTNYGSIDFMDLSGLNGLESITGNLVIDGNNRFLDFSGLNNLESIGGDFRVTKNTFMVNFNGLDNLSYIGGHFRIDGNPNLLNLEGVENLTEVSKLSIYDNFYLESLEGLKINTIDGPFILNRNQTLVNLSGLESLNQINGELSVNQNNNLVNFVGLSGVEKIGSLLIINNPVLENFTGLENLSDVDGPVKIEDNNALINVSGLNSVTRIFTTLQIANNDNLLDFSGLESLEQVNYLNISENDGITNFNGFESLYSIDDGFNVQSNISLIDFEGLEKLESISGFLSVENNDNLINFNGLTALTSNNIEFFVENNNSLENFIGLDNFGNALNRITISDNNSLLNFRGLENIEEISNSSVVQSNASLINFEGLENVKYFIGDLLLNNNSSLLNFEGFDSLISIHSINLHNNGAFVNFSGLENIKLLNSFSVTNNDALLSFTGLENLEEIKFGFLVGGNALLKNFIGLENLKFVGTHLGNHNNEYPPCNLSGYSLESFEGLGNLSVLGNFVVNGTTLKNFKGLENLQLILGGFTIGHYSSYSAANDGLENLSGLENLTSVGESFRITYNDNLSSIDELENLVSFRDMFVSGNPKLTECCMPLKFLEDDPYSVIYSTNNAFCNSVEEAALSCEKIALISVHPFHDENENGIFDDAEYPLMKNFVLEPNAAMAFADNYGVSYFYILDPGTYFLSYNDPLWIADPPLDVSLTVSEFDDLDTMIYVPMRPSVNIIRQRIDLSSSITRCDGEVSYWLTYTNTGTVRTSGIIELIPDDLVTFVSSDPPADSTSNGKLYWFYNDLYLESSEQIYLIYEMPEVEELGEMINFEANMKTNEGYGGHRAILSSELVCSFDPNDKLHVPSGYGKENYTLFGDTLEYTIRFQNTGNDTAFNVEIRDELSELLDLTTFKRIASSHNVQTQIDMESRVATFKFNDIYLPDSFVNEPASHGFVKYQILGKEGLDENSDIENTASIYFDKNPAIVTNTVANRMVSELPSMPVASANPNVLDFGEISLNNPVIEPQILIVSNLGDLPLEINTLDIGNPAFNAGELQSLTIEGQSDQEILIYFEPTEVGDYQSELALKSNVGDLVIQLSGKATLETSLTTLNQSRIQVYPNPNTGKFSIQSLNENIVSYTITNSLGEIVSEQKATSDFLQLDLSTQSKGLYFISIKTKDTMIVERVVVY